MFLSLKRRGRKNRRQKAATPGWKSKCKPAYRRLEDLRHDTPNRAGRAIMISPAFLQEGRRVRGSVPLFRVQRRAMAIVRRWTRTTLQTERRSSTIIMDRRENLSWGSWRH